MQRIRGENPQLMPSTHPTEKQTRAYMGRLLERDQDIRGRAEVEEAGGDPGHFHFLWHRGEDGRALKDASYYVVRRRVGSWERVDG